MILIAPFCQKLRNNQRNAKDFPYWKELISMIDEEIVQVGIEGDEQLVPDFRKNLPMPYIENLIMNCSTFICGDTYLQHMAAYLGKPGIVIFGRSDPIIFGHSLHTNIIKDRNNLRPDQFGIWEGITYELSIFPTAKEVYEYIKKSTL